MLQSMHCCLRLSAAKLLNYHSQVESIVPATERAALQFAWSHITFSNIWLLLLFAPKAGGGYPSSCFPMPEKQLSHPFAHMEPGDETPPFLVSVLSNEERPYAKLQGVTLSYVRVSCMDQFPHHFAFICQGNIGRHK